jgi:hypothetical protein
MHCGPGISDLCLSTCVWLTDVLENETKKHKIYMISFNQGLCSLHIYLLYYLIFNWQSYTNASGELCTKKYTTDGCGQNKELPGTEIRWISTAQVHSH